MRVLVIARRDAERRPLASVVTELAARGHDARFVDGSPHRTGAWTGVSGALHTVRRHERRALNVLLGWLQGGVPVSSEVRAWLRSQSPDVLVVASLIDVGPVEFEYVAAARRLGIRTVVQAGGGRQLWGPWWRRAWPDCVLVWNDGERNKAIRHGIPADRVIVTGAADYDRWFTGGPSSSRAEFCERVGLSADRPFVLYVGSSRGGVLVDEPALVETWIGAIRSSGDSALRDVGILVQAPHRDDEAWRSVDASVYRAVAIHHPAATREDDIDAAHHSAAVVSADREALLGAAIAGRPTHLLPSDADAIRVRKLAASLGQCGEARVAAEAVARVRPFGRDVAAAPRAAEAIERIGASAPSAPRHVGAAAVGARLVLAPVAALYSLQLRSEPWRAQTGQQMRNWYTRRKMELLRRVKQFASEHMGEVKRPKVTATQVGDPALTISAGQRRTRAKTLAGVELPAAADTRKLAAVLRRSTGPIILGPWLSETGFELLYWIPFLAWARTYAELNPDRLVAVSRGGPASWYRHITPHYEDIFSFYTPDQFREANDRRIAQQDGRLKHLRVSELDREIIARVEDRRGLRGAQLLHPSQMYNLFDNFWYQRVPVTLIEAFSSFAALAPPAPSGVVAQLPSRYVAAKFYGNGALPDTPPNRRFVTTYLTELAEHHEVVLLNTGRRFDDHSDFPPSVKGRLHTIEHLMRPEDNLEIQTEVIRHADAFVGTYGGFSYLAPLSGVNTIAFYSHPEGFRFDHLEVAKRVFAGLGCGTFAEIDVRSVDTLRLGFGGAPLTTLAGRQA